MQKDKIYTASSTGLAVLLVLALVGMLNYLAYRHYARADWTTSKLYSLSEKSINILKDLKDPVKVIVFMTPQTPMFTETKELLNRYQAVSKQVSAEYIDPEREPLRTRQLAQEFGVSAANTVVFVAGDRKKYVTADQLAEYDYSGFQMGRAPRMKAFKGEEQFTSAIMGVVNPTSPKVCFTTGHGEHDPEGFGEDGLSQVKEALKRDNLTVEKVNLLSGSVPEGCSLLVVAGPRATFAESEKTAIKSYLDGGGRALVLLDPVLGPRAASSGLEELLKGYGVQVNNDLVVDPGRRLPFFDISAVYVTDFRSHPVVEGMQGLAVLLPVARSVATVTAPGATSTALLTTSDAGWGETDLAAILARRPVDKDGKDTQAPVPLGVAAQSEADRDNGWRLVVIGNSAFMMNGYIANAGNPNLALNAINWLVKREQALGIAPRTPEQVNLFLNASQMRNIMLFSLVGLPALAIVAGVAVWWRRRR
ncbi:MAG TPA: GldG family protein [Thermoanaerobaculaceae bacterium]|nr:GldG family protein [Thermoanaerobaculaceae bacterium]HRS16254.1 GldG family protein [Thermoanaerobaculaceae bacterium]